MILTYLTQWAGGLCSCMVTALTGSLYMLTDNRPFTGLKSSNRQKGHSSVFTLPVRLWCRSSDQLNFQGWFGAERRIQQGVWRSREIPITCLCLRSTGIWRLDFAGQDWGKGKKDKFSDLGLDDKKNTLFDTGPKNFSGFFNQDFEPGQIDPSTIVSSFASGKNRSIHS